jgi:hypothetical protein
LARKGHTTAWDEALRFFSIRLWCPSLMFGCPSPLCQCGAKLESNGVMTSVTVYKGLGGTDKARCNCLHADAPSLSL